METGKRDYVLDLLRFLCAVLMVLTHYEGIFNLSFSGIRFNGGRFYFGLVNEMFFMLSGYLSFRSVAKMQNGLNFDRYFSAKVLRLLPIAALSTMLYALMHRVTWPADEFSLWQVIVTCAGANAGGPFNEMFINSHLWYTSVLLICCALFFIAVRLSQRMKTDWRYACFFMVVLGLSAYTRFENVPFLRHAACRGYMAFFTGVLLASALAKHRPGKAAGWISLSVIAALTALIVFRFEIMEYGLNYMMIFLYYPAVIVLAEAPLTQRLLNRKVFGVLGQISYGIYVWHLEFNVFAQIFDDALDLGVRFDSRWTEFVMVLLNIGIGFASYYLLERPLNRFIKKKTNPAPAQIAGSAAT